MLLLKYRWRQVVVVRAAVAIAEGNCSAMFLRRPASVAQLSHRELVTRGEMAVEWQDCDHVFDIVRPLSGDELLQKVHLTLFLEAVTAEFKQLLLLLFKPRSQDHFVDHLIELIVMGYFNRWRPF